MKVIDLLNKIADEEELPKKILILDEVYYLINDEDGDIVYSQLKDRREWEAFIDHKLNITRCLHEDVIILDEVKIIEEQKEIDIQEIVEPLEVESYECDKTDIRINRETIKKLVQAVKQLKKELKELKEEMYNENDNL